MRGPVDFLMLEELFTTVDMDAALKVGLIDRETQLADRLYRQAKRVITERALFDSCVKTQVRVNVSGNRWFEGRRLH